MSIFTQNRDLNALDSVTAERVKNWLIKCKDRGLKILITETKRGKARQLYLYSKGRYIDPVLEKKYLGYDHPLITSKGQIRSSQVT